MVDEKKIEKLGRELMDLSTEESLALKNHLADKYGLKESQPIITTAPTEIIKKEEKTTFDVILINSGGTSLQVVKEWNHITNLGLKPSKEMIDSPKPVTLKKGISKEEAESIKERLEAQGAEIEIK